MSDDFVMTPEKFELRNLQNAAASMRGELHLANERIRELEAKFLAKDNELAAFKARYAERVRDNSTDIATLDAIADLLRKAKVIE